MNAIASATVASASGPQLDNRRVLAALIDIAVVALGAAVIFAAAGVLGDSPTGIGAPLIAVTLGWALYYYFACESSDSAQTLGKRVMKLRVVRADGRPADVRDIAVRTVVRVVDMQFAYLVGLVVMLATGERRGRLGDLAAGTQIVSADQPAGAPVAAAVAVEQPEARRVPIGESGPAFEPVADEEPVAEAEPVADEEPVVEAEPTPGDDDTTDMASPALQELAADVEASAGTAPDEEEAAAKDDDLVDDDLADDDPLAGPDPETDEEEDAEVEELAPAAEAEAEEAEEDDVKRIETVSAIDLVMEDSQRES